MKVLIAYDGSQGARRALHLAAKLLHTGDTVTVVGVAQGLPLYGHAGTLPTPEQQEERQRQLEEAAHALSGRGFRCALVRRQGDPAAAILDEAEKAGADLVVMGTRGLSAPERWLIGSVSTKVLHHAPCSVLVAR